VRGRRLVKELLEDLREIVILVGLGLYIAFVIGGIIITVAAILNFYV
jgi:hypothetical protein